VASPLLAYLRQGQAAAVAALLTDLLAAVLPPARLAALQQHAAALCQSRPAVGSESRED